MEMAIVRDIAVWERLLCWQQGPLQGIQPGARIGFVHRDDAAGSGGEMIVRARDEERFSAAASSSHPSPTVTIDQSALTGEPRR